MDEAATDGQRTVAKAATDPGPPPAPAPDVPQGTGRWSARSWRAIFFAPVGDGRRRRRGSDAIRVGIALLVVVICWLATRVNPSSEKALISAVTPVPRASSGW